MEPIEYLRIFKRRWKLIGLAVALATIITAGISLMPEEPATEWTATSTLLSKGSVPDLRTLATLAVSDSVAEKAADQLDRSDVENLQNQVAATTSDTPGILNISARASDPDDAEEVAHAFAAELARQVNDGEVNAPSNVDPRPAAQPSRAQLRRKLANVMNDIEQSKQRLLRQVEQAESELELRRAETSYQLRIAQPLQQADLLRARLEQASNKSTEAPPMPGELVVISAPKARASSQEEESPILSVLIGVLVGAVGGAGLALTAEYLDPRIWRAEELARRMEFPIVAQIVEHRSSRSRSDPTLDQLPSDIDLLALKLQSKQPPAHFPGTAQIDLRRTIVLTAPDVEQGKGSVVAQLALALVKTGRKTCVVCCDTGESAAGLLGISESGGGGEVRPNDDSSHGVAVVEHSLTEGLSVICPTQLPEEGANLSSEDIAALLAAADVRCCDWVLVDAPPMTTGTVAWDLTKIADAVIVVTALGRLETDLAIRCGAALRASEAPVVGIVTTQLD